VHRLRPERRGGVRSTCAHQAEDGARWPKEGRVWCGRDGGNRADTAVLVRSTRVSALQPDHVNEPDFDEKSAEGEDSASDSAILSVTYKKLRKTRPEAIAQACAAKTQ
jgi:hypothetical protein